MFYDHTILTSKKHGVATIWLVATLGSRSTLKKITRKAILEVQIAEACEAIIAPDTPMALRLQGSLLYGVSRVYSQQCGYILADAENLRGKMRGVAVMMKDFQTDHTVSATRADQLNLQEDPQFNLDVDFALDMTAFGLHDTSSSSSMLSPHTLGSSQSSLPMGAADESEIALPLLDVGEDFDYNALGQLGGTSSVVRSTGFDPRRSATNEPAIYDNSDFQINEDGEIMIFGDNEMPLPANVTSPNGKPSNIASVAGLSLDHQQTTAAIQGLDDLNLDFGDQPMPPIDDEHTTSAAPPLSPRSAHEQQRQASDRATNIDEEEEVTAEAPYRTVKRAASRLQFDNDAELNNRHLAAWSDHYIANMVAGDEERSKRQALAQAKRNAAFWLFDQGIGGVQVNYGEDRVPHPFSIFSGQALLDALTGMESTAGRKRSLSLASGESEEDGRRRVRSRSEDQHAGRGGSVLPVMDEEDRLLPQDDYPESEIGRRAGSSLKDRSSQMPWNLSSRQGSLRPYGSGLPGISSSIGGHRGSDFGPHSDLTRRRSRMTSASPLIGRGRQLSHLGSPVPGEPTNLTDFDLDELGDIDEQLAGNIGDDFELYGPATGVSTQNTAQGRWIAAVLEKEAHNFLDFLHTSIRETLGDQDTGDVDQGAIHTTTFASLLPPDANSKVVGAQGMLHVLALATKGLIEVDQTEAFGEIRLGVVLDELQSPIPARSEVVEAKG